MGRLYPMRLGTGSRQKRRDAFTFHRKRHRSMLRRGRGHVLLALAASVLPEARPPARGEEEEAAAVQGRMIPRGQSCEDDAPTETTIGGAP